MEEREEESAARRRMEAGAGTARLTPYEIAFLEGDFETRIFPAIREEARVREVDATRLDRFVFLASGGDAVRGIVPPAAPPETLEEYRALFFHAYGFWSYGRRIYTVEPPVARYLVEAAPSLAGWSFETPFPSLYLQLPANLFWASIGTDVPPEPVDGFFVTVASDYDALGVPVRALQALMVLGIHPQRAGFSVVPFESEVGPGVPPPWVEAGREQGRDFENVLPGGEIAGLYSILTTAEALKLVARILWYVGAHPEAVLPTPPAERRDADRPGAVPRSRLEHFRVRLGAEEDGAPR